MRFRALLIVFSFAAVLFSSPVCEAQALNTKVVNYLKTKVGRRIGGGECTDATTEALRVAGAEFDRTDLGPDSPARSDFVWGTPIKSVSFTNGRLVDANPTVKLRPGDIIQYRNVRIQVGSTILTANQHTSIVATVNSAGAPTFVYQQNFNKVRLLKKDAIDISKLTAGYLRIYRPKARKNVARKFKFTIVNNMPTTQAVKMRNNTSNVANLGLAATNRLNSFKGSWMTTSGPINKPNLYIATTKSTLPIVNGAAYEIYSRGGKPFLRRLKP